MTDYDNFYTHRDFTHFKQDETYVQFLKSLLPDPAHSQLLDVGCGRGYWSHLFHKLGIGHVVGIDISQVGLTNAQQEVPDVEFILADAKKLQFKNQTFDMIFCQGLSEFNVDDLSRARPTGLELLRCLKDDGIFVFAYTTNFSGKIKGGWRQHKPAVIRNYLGSLGCRIDNIYLIERAILLKLFGRIAINNPVLKLALPAVCRVTGFPVSLVCIVKK